MTAPPMSASRRALFRLAALVAPLLLLVLAELGLRIAGFGGSYPLFVDYPDVPGARRANPELMRRYLWSPGEPIARIDSFLFQREKPPDGLRIVVQGGSSAAGFPYGRWGGLAGMLGDRLEAAFPEREIEVISTAMAAVSSWTLADLVDEIIAIEPDAVLVYAGHNEYLGILGVGSALTPATSASVARLQLRLRHLRLYQLMQALIGCLRGSGPHGDGSDRDTLFALAASGARIPFGSAAYHAGLRQLESNLGELLAKYRRAGIPVYVGTLVSNERDLPPFAGEPASGVDREAWEGLMQAQAEHREAGRIDEARRALEQLLALDGDAADAWFALGRLEQAAGRHDAARRAYRAAKDRDALRFRAPEEANGVIRRLAAQHGARVVEVRRRFVQASPEGIVGDELLLEHVHPNADGYFLLAEAFYDALRQDGRIGDGPEAPSREQARRDMPLTRIDRILADWDVRQMKAGFPFSDPPLTLEPPAPRDEIERLALRHRLGELDWIHTMEALLQIHRQEGRLDDAARVARLAAHEYPADHGPSYVAGVLLAEAGQLRRARRYLEWSSRAAPDDVASLAALARVDLALGDRELLRRHLDALRRVAPQHPLLERATTAD